jgi:hypothetical protein
LGGRRILALARNLYILLHCTAFSRLAKAAMAKDRVLFQMLKFLELFSAANYSSAFLFPTDPSVAKHQRQGEVFGPIFEAAVLTLESINPLSCSSSSFEAIDPSSVNRIRIWRARY